MFDAFARRMRDKGLHPVESFIAAGISGPKALEIGPGPGYVGLEWLKRLPGAGLTAIEISPDMIALAERNARAYGMESRARYVRGDCQSLPFKDACFDCVFSNGSMHEWAHPDLVFGEIVRVLRPGGCFVVSDLRRDISLLAKGLGLIHARPAAMRAGFLSSVNAAYTVTELRALLASLPGVECSVSKGLLHLSAVGRKVLSGILTGTMALQESIGDREE